MKEQLRIALAILALAAAALACNTANLVPSEPTPSAEPSSTPVPSATQPPATMAIVSPEVTPTVAVVHSLFPSDPPPPARFMTDRSSAALADERRSIADDFNTGLFERPFTSQVMEYKSYIDLNRSEISAGGLWLYVTLFLEGQPSVAEPASYGVEIDLDLDGRGDWIIVGAAPPTTDWTTDGVRAYQDTDNDVGAQTPVRSDPPAGSLTGYETLVFDQGVGPDPDAVWIRLAPGAPNRIQIAFKPGLIGGDNEFFGWGWAFADPQPAWQDYQDHFTLLQAGSPLGESSQYPVKDLALIDSTCRWGYDFNPTLSAPGLCPVPPTPTPPPTPTRTPTQIPTVIIG
jgi:hypothetical protein